MRSQPVPEPQKGLHHASKSRGCRFQYLPAMFRGGLVRGGAIQLPTSQLQDVPRQVDTKRRRVWPPFRADVSLLSYGHFQRRCREDYGSTAGAALASSSATSPLTSPCFQMHSSGQSMPCHATLCGDETIVETYCRMQGSKMFGVTLCQFPLGIESLPSL